MSSQLKNLNTHSQRNVIDVRDHRFAIVVAEWHDHITSKLLKGALDGLQSCGAHLDHIDIIWVPGSYELPQGALLASHKKYNKGPARNSAVIALGCLIQGETRHFDFIAQAVAQGLTHVSLQTLTPVSFGVVTTDTEQQALARAGGEHGNKGFESAIAAVKMVGLSLA